MVRKYFLLFSQIYVFVKSKFGLTVITATEPELDKNYVFDFLHLTFFHSHLTINLIKLINFLLVKSLLCKKTRWSIYGGWTGTVKNSYGSTTLGLTLHRVLYLLLLLFWPVALAGLAALVELPLGRHQPPHLLFLQEKRRHLKPSLRTRRKKVKYHCSWFKTYRLLSQILYKCLRNRSRCTRPLKKQ